jgi:phosphoglucosamine mutase
VDEKGNIVNGDHIMFMCAKYMREQGQLDDDMVVTTVMSNLGLYKALEANGMKYQQTAVGDKYVAENMMENGYAIGGEQSGHIIFSKYATTGDGILTSLMVMQTMIEKKLPLSILASEMKVYPQLLKNVRVQDKEAVAENARLKAEVERVAAALGSDGRILLRPSGTEPKIRVMVEAKTNEICEKYVDEIIEVIKEEGLVLES